MRGWCWSVVRHPPKTRYAHSKQRARKFWSSTQTSPTSGRCEEPSKQRSSVSARSTASSTLPQEKERSHWVRQGGRNVKRTLDQRCTGCSSSRKFCARRSRISVYFCHHSRPYSVDSATQLTLLRTRTWTPSPPNVTTQLPLGSASTWTAGASTKTRAPRS